MGDKRRGRLRPGEILIPLLRDERVQKMREFCQHGDVSTYSHAIRVTKLCYAIDRFFGLYCDRKVLLTGALLHDFYLYDWHDKKVPGHHIHGFIHPKRAARKAVRYFDIDNETRHVIETHMWPLTPFDMPKTKEAWIVCIADKWCSSEETAELRMKRLKKRIKKYKAKKCK